MVLHALAAKAKLVQVISARSLKEIYHAEPGSTVVFGAMSTTGATLKWFRDQFGPAEKEHARREGRDVYELLTAQAAGVEAGAGNLIFLPYMMGERAPIWDNRAQGALFGLSLKTTRAHIIRAILEGVASVLGTPIRLPDNPTGAALLAGVGASVFQDLQEIVNRAVGVAKIIEPDPAWHARYQELFPIYLDLYEHLKHDMHRLATIR